MTVAHETSHVSRPLPPDPPDQPAAWAAGLLAGTGYLGALFLGPFPSLAVLLFTRRKPFLRWHAVQALNASLTWLLYLLCAAIAGGVLALDSLTVALAIMIPVVVAGWVVLAVLLVRATAAASRGGFRGLPAWACATFIH